MAHAEALVAAFRSLAGEASRGEAAQVSCSGQDVAVPREEQPEKTASRAEQMNGPALRLSSSQLEPTEMLLNYQCEESSLLSLSPRDAFFSETQRWGDRHTAWQCFLLLNICFKALRNRNLHHHMPTALRVALHDSLGRTSAELLCPYPPGVPVLFPGETISAAALDQIQRALEVGGTVTGASDPSLSTVLVVIGCDQPGTINI